MNDKSTLIELVAKKTNISFNEAMNITDVILEELHKRLAEYRGINGDYLERRLIGSCLNGVFFICLGFLIGYQQSMYGNQIHRLDIY
jgi:hypothetical protein